MSSFKKSCTNIINPHLASPMLSQRRTRSISTSRTPSLPASSLRPSSRAPPEAARPSSARPCCAAAEDAGLDQNARRNLYMKYSYVPSWVVLAKRHENLFCKVIDYFFKHNAWPDFHKLPEAFRNVCAQYSVEAHHMKRMPGFAPVWLFALRKLDHRYFRATVDHFFDHKAFPHWSWLPQEFVRQFEELGVHERHYFT
ncbi:hypothetical protein R5R35_004245 [Gryllus longicercus]|uniref:Uncharacterized protein n=1 Tax=Gryllus longicercus TaxID=2509291 RepID=A0AAN9ZEJ3_9ORTH